MEDILAALEPTIEYDDGTATGTLALDHSTIDTQVAGYKDSSYTVTATKNYTGLDRNDSSYIDKTVVKDGRTLSLSNITWSVESTTRVGDQLVPATYTAVATYSGTAYSKTATGYITTADYVGTISVSGVSSIKYTVTYRHADRCGTGGASHESRHGDHPGHFPAGYRRRVVIPAALP